MERLKQQLTVLKEALASFKEVLQVASPTLVERDAAIQRFKYTVEAAWKAAQRYLSTVEGHHASSPKGSVRLCREARLLTEDQAVMALEMVDDRNLTVHTYNEKVAEHIYSRLADYARLIETWLNAMEARL